MPLRLPPQGLAHGLPCQVDTIKWFVYVHFTLTWQDLNPVLCNLLMVYYGCH